MPSELYVSLTSWFATQQTAVLLIRWWSVLEKDRDYTGSCCVDCNYAEWTIRTGIKQQLVLHRLWLFYNLHLINMQVFEAFLNKNGRHVMWHPEYEQSIQSRGLGQEGRGSLGLGLVKVKAKPKTFMRCPRGSSRKNAFRYLEPFRRGSLVWWTGDCR